MGDPLIIILFIVSVAVLPTLAVNTEVSLRPKGVIAAVFSSYINNNINVDVVYQYAQFLKDNGVDGVQVAGTTGEGPDISVRDKKRLIDAWVKAAGPLNLYIIVEVGGIPLPDAEELARYAERAGVDALMVLPELYYKAKTPEELVYFLQFVARAAPNTPVLYNDLPQYSGVYVDMVEFVQLATKKIPNFRGIETSSLNNALRVRKYLEKGQRIFIADSPYLGPAALIGFDNFINPDVNIFPKLVIDIVRNGRRGNLRLTRSQFQRLIDLREEVFAKGNNPTDSLNNELASAKATMELVTGIRVGTVKPPIRPLNDDQVSSIADVLKEDGIRIYDSSN